MFHHQLNSLPRWVKSLLTWTGVAGLGLFAMWFLSAPGLDASNKYAMPLTFVSPQFELTKTVDNNTPSSGQQIEYTLTYRNTIPGSQAPNVRLYDFLPAGAQLISTNPQATVYPDGVLLFTNPSIGPGTENRSVKVRVSVPYGYSQLYNHALVEADGVMPAHTSLLTSITQQSSGQLHLSKTGYSYVLSNQQLVYVLRCENTGTSSFTGVTLADVLPAGLALVGASPAPDMATLPLIRWSLGTLAPGEIRSIVVTATAPAAAGTLVNTALLDAHQEVMTQTLFSTQVVNQGAILHVTKAASAQTAHLGDALVYTLHYANDGNQTATGVVLTDTLPSGLTVINLNPPANSTANQQAVWNLGTLAPGAHGDILVTVRVGGASRRTLHNIADITGQPGSFPDHTDLPTPVEPNMLYLPIVNKS